MTEERLKEIKDNMGIQLYSIENVHLDGKIIGEKWELYNEVVRLREIIKEATQKVSGTTICGLRAGKSVIGTYLNELLDILNKCNLTLEQLNGIENE